MGISRQRTERKAHIRAAQKTIQPDLKSAPA
jgi:hypothetical protein